jgi:SAP domain
MMLDFSAQLLVSELKALCHDRGLRFGGAKALLVARLEDSDSAKGAPPVYDSFLLQFTDDLTNK